MADDTAEQEAYKKWEKEMRAKVLGKDYTDLAKVIAIQLHAAGATNPDLGKSLAAIVGQFTNFDIRNSYRLDNLWQSYYGQILYRMTDNIIAFYEYLKTNNYTETNKLEGNGVDRYCWYAEDTENKVIICETQSWNYFVLIEDRYDGTYFHFRRWYPKYVGEKTIILDKNNWNINTLTECADDEYTQYPTRLSLEHFKTHKFAYGYDNGCKGLQYCDLRDVGYILSSSRFAPNEVDRIYENGWVQRVLDNLDAQFEFTIRKSDEEE